MELKKAQQAMHEQLRVNSRISQYESVKVIFEYPPAFYLAK